MADKSAGDFSGSLFLTDNGHDVIKSCRNDCHKLKREFQETLDDLKFARLIIELLQIELYAKYMAKHVSTNNVNIIRGENYDERESGTDKNSWIQVGTGKKKASRRQNYTQIGKQIPISNCFASLLYLQESTVRMVMTWSHQRFWKGKKEKY
jgi:hypothetical protein